MPGTSNDRQDGCSRGDADCCGAYSEANGALPPTPTPIAAKESESPSRHLLSWFGATVFLRKKFENLQARQRQGTLTVGEASELKQMELGQEAFERILPRLRSAKILGLRDIPRVPRGPKEAGRFNFYLPPFGMGHPGRPGSSICLAKSPRS
jgi:hypothetical protein